MEKKPTKKKTVNAPIVENTQEKVAIEKFEWTSDILKTMKLHKDKSNPDNAKVLTKLRKSSCIDEKIFYAKMNELRAEKTIVQKPK